jgi:hypothetical protein
MIRKRYSVVNANAAVKEFDIDTMDGPSPTTHLDSEASGSQLSAVYAMSTQIRNERRERSAIDEGSHMDRQSVAGYGGGPRSDMLYSLPQGSGQGRYCNIGLSYHCFRRVRSNFHGQNVLVRLHRFLRQKWACSTVSLV